MWLALSFQVSILLSSLSLLGSKFKMFVFLLFGLCQTKKLPSVICKMCRFTIILHMCKVLSGDFFSIKKFYSIQWFCLWTGKALIRLCRCAGWSGPLLSVYTRRHVFCMMRPIYIFFFLPFHPWVSEVDYPILEFGHVNWCKNGFSLKSKTDL